MDPEKFFFVDDDVKNDFASIKRAGKRAVTAWNKLFAEYAVKYPEEAALFKAMQELKVENLDNILPKFEAGTKMATRAADGKVLAALGKAVP